MREEDWGPTSRWSSQNIQYFLITNKVYILIRVWFVSWQINHSDYPDNQRLHLTIPDRK